jgi:hypothetical protein
VSVENSKPLPEYELDPVIGQHLRERAFVVANEFLDDPETVAQLRGEIERAMGYAVKLVRTRAPQEAAAEKKCKCCGPCHGGVGFTQGCAACAAESVRRGLDDMKHGRFAPTSREAAADSDVWFDFAVAVADCAVVEAASKAAQTQREIIEGRLCPEDVGIEEYVHWLEKKLEDLAAAPTGAAAAELRAGNSKIPPLPASINRDAAAAEGEAATDSDCREDDGCPTELAVLRREWRSLTSDVEALRRALSQAASRGREEADREHAAADRRTEALIYAAANLYAVEFNQSLDAFGEALRDLYAVVRNETATIDRLIESRALSPQTQNKEEG